ncbi:hypothetical protein H0H92_002710 [Tricholoma furcatifolium]|nr:hypothetical protein H0H92_002710 [Tricholoma furcatifolium]
MPTESSQRHAPGSETTRLLSRQTSLDETKSHLAVNYTTIQHIILLVAATGSYPLTAGVFSAVFLIFNCVIGTGIYATPSIILRCGGSIGVALLLWVAGALLAFTGTVVYMELGTRTQAANSIVFGEYVAHALSLEPSRFNIRGIALLCLTFCFLAHAVTPTFGLRLQNILGLSKLLILWAIATAGILCLFGVPGFSVDSKYEPPDNFAWSKFWKGSAQTSPNALVTGLFNVLWSFNGYTYVNQVLGEVQDPVRTVRRAAPLAMVLAALTYIVVNIGYFAAVAKTDILDGGRIVAALFFRNLFGPATETALSVIIAMSVLGNVLAALFTHARVIQELGREGVLPRSSFFASNKPFNGPMAAIFTQYFMSSLFMLAPPPGDAYLFMISLSTYSIAHVNMIVSFGLLLLHTTRASSLVWHPPFRAPTSIIATFFMANVCLVVVPLFPPTFASRSYEYLPYWIYIKARSPARHI